MPAQCLRGARRLADRHRHFPLHRCRGSTRLLHELGVEAYAEALAEHRRLIREACARESDVEVDTQGETFFFAFPTAPGAIPAARAISEGLAVRRT